MGARERGDGRDGENTRGDGTDEEDEIADDVRRIAEDDCAGRRTFEEDGAAEVGGAGAERLRLSEGSTNLINGDFEEGTDEVPATL